MTGHPFWDWLRAQPRKRRMELLGIYLEVRMQFMQEAMR